MMDIFRKPWLVCFIIIIIIIIIIILFYYFFFETRLLGDSTKTGLLQNISAILNWFYDVGEPSLLSSLPPSHRGTPFESARPTDARFCTSTARLVASKRIANLFSTPMFWGNRSPQAQSKSAKISASGFSALFLVSLDNIRPNLTWFRPPFTMTQMEYF